jgi:hypothetical protein
LNNKKSGADRTKVPPSLAAAAKAAAKTALDAIQGGID